MLTRRKIFVLVGLALVLLAGCNDKTDDYQLTDLYQISQLLTRDPLAISIFPPVWLDVTNREPQSPGTPPTSGSITPSDYWVEIISHNRSVPTANDSCKADEYNQANPCAEIQVEEGTRAHVRNAAIADSLVCRYHIIDENTRGVIVKDVTYSQSWYAMMAKLNSDDASYRGWSFYAVGGQWQRATKAAGSPVLDSVVLRWGDQHLVTTPKAKSANTPLKQLPRISAGEAVQIDVYANKLDPTIMPEEVYVSYEIAGAMKHFLMDDHGNGHFGYADMEESSGGGTSTYSQIVIEAFHPQALHSVNPQVFGAYVWAMTYRITE
jgi:hypothetical protein